MSPSRRRRRASPEWEGREVITVAALPGRGLYVRHLGHPEGVDGVHRPTVPPPGAQPRPPAYFERHWLADHADDVDVVHVHGVPPRLSTADLEAAVEVTREAGLPLVVTAYHLSDPAGIDEDHYAEQLQLLVRSADAVITITPGAAEELARRFDASATVLPHPHAVDFVRMRRARPDGGRRTLVVGAHLGSLRMPGDPVAFVRALADAVTQVPDARLAVHLHDHLLDPDSSRYAPDTIGAVQRIVADAGGVARAHRPMTDSQLWDHLFALDVSVVPPLFGSHSIWPEACHDLGTHVALPAGQPRRRAAAVPDVRGEGRRAGRRRPAGRDRGRPARRRRRGARTRPSAGRSGSASPRTCGTCTSACWGCAADGCIRGGCSRRKV
jgi:hypothetical protein